MPQLDGTGPEGEGPKTGRGLGTCPEGVSTQPYTAPNCPTCGQFMDKIESWVCKSCGELKKNE